MTTDVTSRFWAKVDKLPGEDACWEWTAALFTDSGYGCFSFQKTVQGAHRVSWVLANGPITGGLWVLHKCDNRKCVRPAHLFLGTQTDNMRDMVAKGRGVPPTGDEHWMRKLAGVQSGAANFNAKLSEEQVAAVKVSLVAKEPSGAIAKRLGVSGPTISLIASGQNWGHVPWPDGASFDVDCPQALRSRGIRRARANLVGGACATEECPRTTTGLKEHCDECWAVRRRESKKNHASAQREKARAA